MCPAGFKSSEKMLYVKNQKKLDNKKKSREKKKRQSLKNIEDFSH